MRQASHDALVEQITNYVEEYEGLGAWENEPAEAAAHIVDNIVVPFYANLPGAAASPSSDTTGA